MTDFSYHRPTSLADAFELAKEHGTDAAFLAGGTELVPDYRRGREEAGHLISLRDVPGLADIRDEGGAVHIGAMARLQDVADSDLLRDAFPALAEAAATIGGSQVRHQGTIGGNFCRAVPCADTPPSCIAGGATLEIVSTDGKRSLPAESFFLGPRATVLDTGEVLSEIVVPAQPENSGTSYQRFTLRKGQALAVAAVAARVVLNGDSISSARIVLSAVAPVPYYAVTSSSFLAGKPATAEVFTEAAGLAAEEARPIDDIRGTAEFRTHLTKVLTERALVEATRRAGGAA
ncbi:MAG: xanthine dehydrogenase family protein subunit M [Planctomycetota bacterium]